MIIIVPTDLVYVVSKIKITINKDYIIDEHINLSMRSGTYSLYKCNNDQAHKPKKLVLSSF